VLTVNGWPSSVDSQQWTVECQQLKVDVDGALGPVMSAEC